MEFTGKTVEEAVKKGLQTLGVKSQNAIINIINEPAQGLFSLIGSKTAKVDIEIRLVPEQYIKYFIENLLKMMNIKVTVEVIEDDDSYKVSVYGDKVGSLIGRRGKTLYDLQYLLNNVIRRQFSSNKKRVLLDIENYREKRQQTLIRLAENVAKKVIGSGREISLEPMNPQERRVIHVALKDYPEIVTYSKGEEPYRKIVIAPR